MRLLVWGMGIKFSLLKDRIINMEDVIGFIDNNFKETVYLDKPIYRPDEILDIDYDAIIVANNSTESIYLQCVDLDIDLQKVIFLFKNWKFEPLIDNYSLTKKIFGTEFADFLKCKYHIVNSATVDEVDYSRLINYIEDPLYNDDYVRVSTLIFAAEEIKRRGVLGAVAELGVFRGDFACSINRAFPEKKLYLFDTFEGFNEKEVLNEMNRSTCNEVYIDAFKRTNLDLVMEKMPFKEKVEFRVGVFPESLQGLDEKFAFVSLDVDLKESTYEGLNYFYPRLSVGGYLFIHDYNYGYFNSVREAVEKYEAVNQIRLAKVPICDYDGTVVVTK